MALKYVLGDRVLALGRPGVVAELSEDLNAAYPYRISFVGSADKLLYAERELEPMPDQGSDAVWEAMAYSYWKQWRETQDKMDELKLKIRGLIEDAFA
jgi:hypothetical protein